MKYTFTIVLHILLPNHEAHDFRIYSPERYGEMFCLSAAREAAERYVNYTQQRIRFAIVSAEASCERRDTRIS